MWTDEFLVWDPEEFDGINEISLSSDAIWIPDVIVTELYEMTKLFVLTLGFKTNKQCSVL